jgi:hypothetical protein
MKVWMARDTRFDIYVYSPLDGPDDVEITEELYQRYKDNQNEWTAIQNELREAYERTT